jgi:hypothetical protein
MRKFGLEVEFQGDLAAVLREFQAEGLAPIDLRRTHSSGSAPTSWVVKRDGSVPYGGEVVSPPLDFDDPDQREQVTRAILAMQRAGATTCPQAGIHVHVEAVNFDGTPLNGKQLAAIVRFTYKFEDAIYRIASSGWQSIRPGARTYAKPIPEATALAIMKARTLDEVRNVWNGMSANGARRGRANRVSLPMHDRYTATNLDSLRRHNTVEFRYFNTSVNPVRIQTYIALCVAIVDDARHGFSRSVKKSYRIGDMASGRVKESAVLLRLQQVLRTESKDTKVLMSEADWKNLRKVCWKGSVPQQNIWSARGYYQ